MHLPLPLLLHTLLLAAAATTTTTATPTPPAKRQNCATRLQRRAWHTFTSPEKHHYLNAERCLMFDRPARTRAEGAVSRFDDLLGAHQHQAGWIHGTGWFLPWHRLHMAAHEKLLREECGYTGAQPYWDESLDAGRFSSSAIFSPHDGFGGGGDAQCIRDGPFAGYTLHMGPGYSNTAHCIRREINDDVSRFADRGQVEHCLGQDGFEGAWRCIESNPHVAGHRGVGGGMDNAISSPGDPLFYLHHTFLDRIWWQWQERNLDARLREISGPTTANEPDDGGWVAATLDDVMDVHGTFQRTRIADLMDIRGPVLCYEYV